MQDRAGRSQENNTKSGANKTQQQHQGEAMDDWFGNLPKEARRDVGTYAPPGDPLVQSNMLMSQLSGAALQRKNNGNATKHTPVMHGYGSPDYWAAISAPAPQSFKDTIQRKGYEKEEEKKPVLDEFKTPQKEQTAATADAPPPDNNTGLPDNLKSGIENLSGHSMDDVKVHYNSAKPAQMKAHAYAQGTNIHVAPGQEKHLPHEAWHVAQQKQGRVQATTQMKGIAVNDDTGLEKEAMTIKCKLAAALYKGSLRIRKRTTRIHHKNL